MGADVRALVARGEGKAGPGDTLAGKLLGPTAPAWQRLEALCQEYLGTHPVETRGEESGGLLHWPAAQWLESAKEALEEETQRWAFLESVDPVAAPDRAASRWRWVMPARPRCPRSPCA